MRFEINRASNTLYEEPQPTPAAVKKDGDWEIEINTLEELMALVELEGKLVIGQYDIWIYDSYME